MLQISNDEWQKFSSRVYTWSVGNFGKQRSKANPLLELNSLIPLMGIVEEFSEFSATRTKEEEFDAIADTCIFMADYYQRENMSCDVGKGPTDSKQALVLLGKLYHVTIKYHQGIRGYEDVEKYKADRDTHFINLLYAVDKMARNVCRRPLLDCGKEVFEKVVAKRNWVTSPTNG